MLVQELYEKYNKSPLWQFRISSSEGHLIAWLNESNPIKKIHPSLLEAAVENISVGYESLSVTINIIPEAAYVSEERCQMDGYELLYTDAEKGPIYVKDILILNAYSGDVDHIGYTFATIEK